MAVMVAHEPVSTEEAALPQLEDVFLNLNVPGVFRAELIEGAIVVTPPPDGEHEDVISSVIRAVLRHATTQMDVSGNRGLMLPADDAGLRGHVIPDATFAPRERRLFRGAPPWMSPDGVTMVVEVTGNSPDRDRIAKRTGYAAARVPCHLLVDREQETVTLFSEPAKGDYADRHTVDFGKPLPLPEPFGFDLETSDLA